MVMGSYPGSLPAHCLCYQLFTCGLLLVWILIQSKYTSAVSLWPASSNGRAPFVMGVFFYKPAYEGTCFRQAENGESQPQRGPDNCAFNWTERHAIRSWVKEGLERAPSRGTWVKHMRTRTLLLWDGSNDALHSCTEHCFYLPLFFFFQHCH